MSQIAHFEHCFSVSEEHRKTRHTESTWIEYFKQPKTMDSVKQWTLHALNGQYLAYETEDVELLISY